MELHRTSPQSRREQRLAQRLARASQAITVAELRAIGYNKSAIQTLLDRGRLVRVYRGVYRSGDVYCVGETANACALLAAGPQSCLALLSAAHRMGLVKYPPPQIQVAVPTSAGLCRPRGFSIVRLPTLTERDIRRVNGQRTSTPERTIFDLSSHAKKDADWTALRRALKQATTRDSTLPARLRARLSEITRRPGAARLLGLLGDHLPATADFRSDFEEDFVDFCRVHDLPIPETNVSILGKLVDVAWIKYRVVLELDTYTFHGDVAAFESDRRVGTKLAAANYLFARITARRSYAEPLDVLADIRQLLALGGWTG